MASHGWQELVDRQDLPRLAIEFKRGELIRAFSNDLKGAVWMALHAVWVTDDQKPSASPALRREAAIRVEESMAAGTPYVSQNGGNESLLADLLRRSGNWDAARCFAKAGIAAADSSMVRSVLTFQLKLIEAKDWNAHKIEEAWSLNIRGTPETTIPHKPLSQLSGNGHQQEIDTLGRKNSPEPTTFIHHQQTAHAEEIICRPGGADDIELSQRICTTPIYRSLEPAFLLTWEYEANSWSFIKHSELRLQSHWTDNLIRKYLGNPDYLVNAAGTVLDLESDDFSPTLTRLFLVDRVEAAMKLKSWWEDAKRVQARRDARERAKESPGLINKVCIVCEREKAMNPFEFGWRCKYCGYEAKSLD